MESYHRGIAGEFYVAAELSRRGYIVTLTLGQAKTTDLLVQSSKKQSFSVEVKTLKDSNFYRFDNPESSSDDWFWVFVLISDNLQEKPRYFIMRSDTVLQEWNKRHVKYPDDTQPGLNWGVIKDYENNWEILPE